MSRYQFASAFQPLFRPHRYKVTYGGRGGAKSWSIARALIQITHTSTKRIGCFRELQSSIKDSVHQLLRDQIDAMGLTRWFYITDKEIVSLVTGSQFLFKGLRHNSNEIKSTEGLDIVWVEEAQLVSKDSWDMLIPTVRKANSEIWISFNPLEEADPTYQRFVVNPPPNAAVMYVNWRDNPWFPEVLEIERLYCLQHAPEDYDHIWEGKPRTISDAVVFKDRYVIEAFDTPDLTKFYHGMDFGFANDPAVLVRMYLSDVRISLPNGKIKKNQDLWIDEERYGYGVEIDDLPQMMEEIPTSKYWPIKADSSRPEIISYLRRQGFNIKPAEKWPMSVEDGVAHLKGFNRIHIHARCKKTQEEYRLYKYKVDKKTNLVLPEIVDAWNHSIDGQRYGLDDFIHKRGVHEMWGRL